MIVLLLVHETLGNWNKAFRREFQVRRLSQAAQAVERGHPATNKRDSRPFQQGDGNCEKRRCPDARGACLTMSCRLFHTNLHFHHNQRFVLFLSAKLQRTLIFLNRHPGEFETGESKLLMC
jgi:hypothetical protein